MARSTNPFWHIKSSPEVARLVVMIQVRKPESRFSPLRVDSHRWVRANKQTLAYGSRNPTFGTGEMGQLLPQRMALPSFETFASDATDLAAITGDRI